MIVENVNLSSNSYPIFIGEESFDFLLYKAQELKAESKRILCIADESVCLAQPDALQKISALMPVVQIPSGENSKSMAMFSELCSELTKFGMDRKSSIFAWGGGVTGDLAGFVSASYMRGIDFYQVPTTLLAMVDSSVGGKTAINIPEGKNLVGAFHQPKAVFMNTAFLKTLPQREFSAGMAELIKCAMINDAQFFSELESLKTPLNAEHEFLPRAIQKACAMKARIVSADEKETAKDGGRALLNLGHTFGHAIEKCAGFGQWLHGEAVAMGIVMCMIYSKKLGIFAESDFSKVKKLLESYNLPTSLNPKLDASKMLESMFHDKKTESGKLRLVLLNGIGKAFTQVGNPELVENTITEFLAS